MELLSAIDSRVSATRLGEPGPTREHIQRILEAGARAPDHGRLRPWRFLVVEGAAREKLGELMAERLRARVPDATHAQIDAERGKALRAPTVIVVATAITRGKIPEIEQVVAVGAAVQNMFLAARALGYGAMWKTGAACYDPVVKTTLGFGAEDHVVALFYVGKPLTEPQAQPPALEGLVRWL